MATLAAKDRPPRGALGSRMEPGEQPRAVRWHAHDDQVGHDEGSGHCGKARDTALSQAHDCRKENQNKKLALDIFGLSDKIDHRIGIMGG